MASKSMIMEPKYIWEHYKNSVDIFVLLYYVITLIFVQDMLIIETYIYLSKHIVVCQSSWWNMVSLNLMTALAYRGWMYRFGNQSYPIDMSLMQAMSFSNNRHIKRTAALPDQNLF